jgi:hypothetical protein
MRWQKALKAEATQVTAPYLEEQLGNAQKSRFQCPGLAPGQCSEDEPRIFHGEYSKPP